MAARAGKKRRVQTVPVETNGHATPLQNETDIEPPYQPPTAQEKADWQGFSEIDSEPALFNYMLKAWGVEGVKVQELFGIDDSMIVMLPKPVYGLIFLFRYRSENEHDQEASCPDHVWFANQTNDYSCATMSLLNIVNNIPNVELGEILQNFKDFTKDFTPAQRGEAIGNFAFLKSIHNSFARRMDMLNIDLIMENQFDDRKKKKTHSAQTSANNNGKKSKKREKNPKPISDEDEAEEEAGFHFSAYVPIEGQVWKLDGLNRQPVKLGAHGQDWLSTVIPFVEGQMAEYMEDQIEFALFSLVRDPLIDLQTKLDQTDRDLRLVREQLKAHDTHPEPFDKTEEDGPGMGRSVSMEAIDSAAAVNPSSGDVRQLQERRSELELSQDQMRACIAEEAAAARDDERRAAERMHDYGPLIFTWLKMLAEKEGVVQDLVEELR